MGTSSNQASPDLPSWRLARAALARTDVAVERQLRELWRAALAERGHQLYADLTGPEVRGASAIAAAEESPESAMAAFDGIVRKHGRAGVTLDLCRRALGRAVAGGGGTPRFASELFS